MADFLLAALSLLLVSAGILLYAHLRHRKPRLEVLPHDAGAKAFADQLHRERIRRIDRG